MIVENAGTKCPKCKTGGLSQRVPRGFLVKNLLFWLPIKRYRCGKCNKKSYVYGQQKAGKHQLKVM